MRLPLCSLLLLAASLPALAHPDWDDHGGRHPWRHRRVIVAECPPRYLPERPLTPRWEARPRVVVRESAWCDPDREVVFMPPPPVIVRPRLRLWIGF